MAVLCTCLHFSPHTLVLSVIVEQRELSGNILSQTLLDSIGGSQQVLISSKATDISEGGQEPETKHISNILALRYSRAPPENSQSIVSHFQVALF